VTRRITDSRAGELERLAAELEDVFEARRQPSCSWCNDQSGYKIRRDLADLLADRQDDQKRIAELEAALAPIAALAPAYAHHTDESCAFVRVGDVRRAAALVGERQG
jgi:hypothetical protein